MWLPPSFQANYLSGEKNEETSLVVHGGAPTAVINASLYGVIKEAEGRYDAVYGAKGGSGNFT